MIVANNTNIKKELKMKKKQCWLMLFNLSQLLLQSLSIACFLSSKMWKEWNMNGIELDDALKLSCLPFYKLGLMENLVALEVFNFYWKENFLARHGFSHRMMEVVTRPWFFVTTSIMAWRIWWQPSQLPSWGDRTHDAPVLDFLGIPF